MMTKAKRSFLLVTLLLAAALVPTAAYTYTLLNPARYWTSVPVKVCVQGPGHASITANDLDRGVTATLQALNGNHPSRTGTGWNVTSVGPVVDAVLVDATSVNAGSCNASW